MIKLFEANAKNFDSNGIVVIHPLKLNETKKKSLNGWFIDVELDLKYKDMINQDMLAVVKTKSKLRPQAFRINNVKYTNKKITFTADHVMFDAELYYLKDVRPTAMSADAALNYVNERTDANSPFSFFSDVNASNTAYFLDRSLLYAMEKIEERWGGEYDADNFDISLRREVGVDRGEVISYGKNLEGVQIYENWSSVATKIFPIGYDDLRLPEEYLESDIEYPTPYTRRIDINTDSEASEEDQILELRSGAEAYLEENQYPKISYEVNSNINQDLGIGDLVYVKHPLVDLETTVQEYQYNILKKRVTKIIFGNYNRSVKKKFEQIKDSIEDAKEYLSKFDAIVQNQTDLINSLNKTGHVWQDENQILILDKLPMESAENVWRWNLGGFAFSENGVEGPYKMAFTIDGSFNTDFISSGSIMTNHLSSDVGSDLDLSSNETIRISGKTVFASGYDPTEKATPSDVSTAETNAKNHADSAAGSALSDAKGYADTASSNALSSAKAYSDGLNTAIDAALKAYTDAQLNAFKGDLGDLAFANKIGSAMLDETLIVGGFLKTSLIHVDDLSAISATIAGFNINGNEISSYEGGDNETNYLRIMHHGFIFGHSDMFPSNNYETEMSAGENGFLIHYSKQESTNQWSGTKVNAKEWYAYERYNEAGTMTETSSGIEFNWGSLAPNRYNNGNYNLGTSGNRFNMTYLKSQPNVSSDARLKENIQEIPNDLIDLFMKLEPKMYMQEGKLHFGYIAQDVSNILEKWKLRNPLMAEINFALFDDEGDFLSLIYGELAVLKNKELSKRLELLENERKNK